MFLIINQLIIKSTVHCYSRITSQTVRHWMCYPFNYLDEFSTSLFISIVTTACYMRVSSKLHITSLQNWTILDWDSDNFWKFWNAESIRQNASIHEWNYSKIISFVDKFVFNSCSILTLVVLSNIQPAAS